MEKSSTILLIEWATISSADVSLFQITVKEIRDNLEHGFLNPVFAAVRGTGDEVTLTRDATFLQSLVEQIGLARRDNKYPRYRA